MELSSISFVQLVHVRFVCAESVGGLRLKRSFVVCFCYNELRQKRVVIYQGLGVAFQRAVATRHMPRSHMI